MTVKDVLEALQNSPPDQEVVIWYGKNEAGDLYSYDIDIYESPDPALHKVVLVFDSNKDM